MRWATSGRLTPAAATFTRIWPRPGCGVGTEAALSTSGPPGFEIAMAVMVSGTLAMGLLLRASPAGLRLSHARGAPLRQEAAHARLVGRSGPERQTMDWDELKPRVAKATTLGEDLRTLSVGELEQRLVEL